MDSPATIIFSELFGHFGLNAAEICAFACTCGAAATRVRSRVIKNDGSGEIVVPRYPIEFRGFSTTTWHKFNSGGIFLAYGGVYNRVGSMQMSQLLHKLALNRASYVVFSISDHKIGDGSVAEILRSFGAMSVTPINTNGYTVVTDSMFYSMRVDPFAVLPKHLHDQVGIVKVLRRQN